MELKPIGLGDFDALAARLGRLSDAVDREGKAWVRDRANAMHQGAISNLQSQGRGGQPPPLSAATKEIYRHTGDPDGTGIRNHIQVSYIEQGAKVTAIVGIPEGKPSMIAHVQEDGAAIAVTPKMRGWLAAHGVYLRASTTHINVPGRHFWSDAWRSVDRDRPNLFQ